MATGLNRSRAFLVAVSVAIATLLVGVGGSAQQIHTIPADEVVLIDPAPPSPQQSGDLDCVYDCGDSDDSGDTWGYICELGNYQAWFGFDLSSISDGAMITSMSFTAMMENYNSFDVERSLWYHGADAWIDAMTCPGDIPADEMVGTFMHGPDAAGWETIDIDMSLHDWQVDLDDDRVSLMLTGPSDGSHYCGAVYFMESESMPFLTVVEGVPTVPGPALVLLIVLLLSATIAVLRT